MINFFKKLFRKKTVEQTGTYDSKYEKIDKKVVLIVGHSPTDSGAIAFNKTKEFDYNHKVALYMHKKHGIEYVIRGSTGIAGAALSALSKNPEYIIELHLNSFSNPAANGCEVLVLKGDTRSIEVAEKFAKMFTDKFKRRLRARKGVKEIAKTERGGFSLSVLSPAPVAILVEPFFCSNPNEWIEVEKYVEFLEEFIGSL